MTKHKVKDPKAIICIVLFTLFLCAIIILFTMGGIFFGKEHPKVLHYANSMCRVYSQSCKTYQCTSRYFRYTCYGPTWNANYGENGTRFALVEVESRFRSYSDAFNKLHDYQIGSSYSCWYDTRHPTVAQWAKPSTTIGIILLAGGGLSILLSGFFLFLGVRLVKQEILQKRHDAMEPYSYASPYLKQ